MLDYYAVMGNPVIHSQSPFIHAQFAKETHQQMRYITLDVPIDQFSVHVKAFQLDNGKGLNVTAPFKQQAYNLVTTVSDRAHIAKAVNTISFLENGDLFGDNTDGIGLIRDLTINHHYPLNNKRILILGAGGAVRGILHPLLQQQPQKIVIANRTRATALMMAQEFGHYGSIDTTEPHDIVGCYDLIINGTRLGLQQVTFGIASYNLSESVFCYDLIYGQELTPFLKWSLDQGVKKIADGTGMLVEQAAESFYIWRGIRPSTTHIIAQLMHRKKYVSVIE
jgi:shikimate dehydrogenase